MSRGWGRRWGRRERGVLRASRRLAAGLYLYAAMLGALGRRLLRPAPLLPPLHTLTLHPLTLHPLSRAMSGASARQLELEALPKSELVQRLLAAEGRDASAGAEGEARGKKRAKPDPSAGAAGKKARGKGKGKKQRGFDMSRCRQRHVALKIAYYGQSYHGFASQDDIDNTIEGHLFRALQQTCLIVDRDSCNYSRCGRTDKGVSALGQVVALHLRTKLTDDAHPALLSAEAVAAAAAPKAPAPDDDAPSTGRPEPPALPAEAWATSQPEAELDYIKMLNGVLPHDIRVLGWAHLPPAAQFSARFSCRRRVYHYYFARGALDTEAMAQAAAAFVGEHDFRNFCKMDIACAAQPAAAPQPAALGWADRIALRQERDAFHARDSLLHSRGPANRHRGAV